MIQATISKESTIGASSVRPIFPQRLLPPRPKVWPTSRIAWKTGISMSWKRRTNSRKVLRWDDGKSSWRASMNPTRTLSNLICSVPAGLRHYSAEIADMAPGEGSRITQQSMTSSQWGFCFHWHWNTISDPELVRSPRQWEMSNNTWMGMLLVPLTRLSRV